jgi:hypothetical protein
MQSLPWSFLHPPSSALLCQALPPPHSPPPPIPLAPPFSRSAQPTPPLFRIYIPSHCTPTPASAGLCVTTAECSELSGASSLLCDFVPSTQWQWDETHASSYRTSRTRASPPRSTSLQVLFFFWPHSPAVAVSFSGQLWTVWTSRLVSGSSLGVSGFCSAVSV